MTREKLQVNNGKQGLIYFSAFALPVLMFMLLCAVNHKLPFGDDTYLGGDMVNQYIRYFGYLQSIATGENDAFYTYTKALGGDMTGIWAYYLLSPLNLVFLFVPKMDFPAAVTFITAVKLGLCGLSMAVLLSWQRKARTGVLAFSCAYAFMSYNLLYFNNIMWLDGVYMLPLIIMGVELISEGRSAWLYVLCLSLALVFNYYIGYMICIFVLLFFAYRMLLFVMDGKSGLMGRILSFACASLLSGALAAVVLVPTALSLSGTKASFDTAKLAMFSMYDLGQHLSKLVCGAMPTGYVEGDELMRELPSIYCGAVVSILALLYFFNSRIRLSKRLLGAGFVILLYLSFNLNGTYLVWHAFNYPALFPYRNAFLASFLMIWFAWQCYANKDGISLRGIILSLVLVGLALLLIDPVHNLYISRKLLLLDIAAMLLCVLLFISGGKLLSERFCAALLTVLQCFLLLVNAQAYAKGTLNYQDYKQEYISTQEKVDRIKSNDRGFYRLGRTGAYSNDGMLYLYNGLDHFSSAEKTATKNFAVNFGFWHFMDVWVHYRNGATASGDAFLGFKYLMGNIPSYKNYETVPGEEYYYNPNALGIAMLADKQTMSAAPEENNIFLWQEQVFSSVLGRSADIFSLQQDVELEIVNMGQKPFEDEATEYYQLESGKDCALIYRFTATDASPLYMYTTMPRVEGDVSARIKVNGKDMGRYMGSYYWRAAYIGCFEPGTEVEVVISPSAPFFLQKETTFAYENQETLSRVCAEINTRTEAAGLTKIKNSHLVWHGSVRGEGAVLLLSIPNDSGWRAEIDGESADIITAFGALIALELAPGEHTVELRFTPPGLYAGLGISLAALLIFVILLIKKKI